MTQQLTLPLEAPTEAPRSSHPFGLSKSDSPLCPDCGRVLWAPEHGLAPGELERIRERLRR